MDWESERYVRFYTRRTADDLALCWQAMTLWPHLLAVSDRAGYIHIKQGDRRLKLLAGLLRMPLDFVLAAMPDLLEDGRVREVSAGYFIPNYIVAQEATSSDAERQRKRRERLRDQGLAELKAGVTKRDDVSRNVTKQPSSSRNVTDGHVLEQKVTPYRTVPSRTVLPPPTSSARPHLSVVPEPLERMEEEEIDEAREENRRVLEAGKEALLALARGEDLDLEPSEQPWSIETFSARWTGYGNAIGRPRGLDATRGQRRALEALLGRRLPSELTPALDYFHSPPKGDRARWPACGYPLGIFLEVAERHLGRPAERFRLCCVCHEPSGFDSPTGRALCAEHSAAWWRAFEEDHPARPWDFLAMRDLTERERLEDEAEREEEEAARELLKPKHFALWLQVQSAERVAS